MRIDLDERSWLDYRPGWIAARAAAALADSLRAELAWEQRTIVLFGRAILQPRLIAWAGERAYRYSGQTLEPRPLSPALASLRERVVSATDVAFNHVLVNRYRDGDDSMGMHADDEPELGPSPQLASISLGATRRFVLVARRGKQRHRIALEHGSLLIMRGETQHRFRHGLPKQRTVHDERINLTFRRLLRDPSKP